MQSTKVRPAQTRAASGLGSLGHGIPIVEVQDGTVLVHELRVEDADAAAFLGAASEGSRVDLARTGLKVGLNALEHVSAAADVDFVRRQFDALLAAVTREQDDAMRALKEELRRQFGDGGRLPETMERFLGDEGKLRALLEELFDESRRTSAMGQIRGLLRDYFDGDTSVLGQLLDPTRERSPLHALAKKIDDGLTELHEQIAAMDAARVARNDERRRSTAKGIEFEDLLETPLARSARSAGDTLERTGATAGLIAGCKRGDFTLTVDPAACSGLEARVVIEAKDRKLSLAALGRELREAKENRAAVVGMVVFSADAAPASVSPLQVVGSDVYCVYSCDDDLVSIEAGLRLARGLAAVLVSRGIGQADIAAMTRAVADVRGQIETIQTLRRKLTSASASVASVADSLEEMRSAVLRGLASVDDAIGDGNVEVAA